MISTFLHFFINLFRKNVILKFVTFFTVTSGNEKRSCFDFRRNYRFATLKLIKNQER